MKLHIPKSVVKNKNNLFKDTAYDIRAYTGEPENFFNEDAILTPEAMNIAGTLMGLIPFKSKTGKIFQLKEGDKVVVGYDNGPTSQILAEAFSKGLNSQGINVYWIGISSSGQVYQCQDLLNAQGYCQITRSHVEVTSNGAKFGIGTQSIHTYLLGQMNQAVTFGINVRKSSIGTIINKEQEAKILYFNKLKQTYSNYFLNRDNNKISINLFGGTGLMYTDLFKDILGKDITILGNNINVNNGTLLADPTRKEMLSKVPKLQKTLDEGKRVHSFDLDADRGSLTEGKDALLMNGVGHYLGDSLCFLLADYKINNIIPKLIKKLKELHLSKDKISQIIDIVKIIYIDPRYTSSVKNYIDNTLKGNTKFHCKGHSLWKETMTENMNKITLIAGFNSVKEFISKTEYRDIQIEASLHLFATDTINGIPIDDAIENIFLLEKILDDMKIQSLDNYFIDKPKRFMTKEVRTIAASNERKESITFNIIRILKEKFKERLGYSIVEFDGQIRVDWSTGFIMYGMSNTSPKLTFMAEGSSIDERNEALAYLTAMHNEAKRWYNDNTLIDIKENSFYTDDESYNMQNPDQIDFSDIRVRLFLEKVEEQSNK